MSKTAFERANPPPRRKSCAACTKAKRRCDLSYPSCVRCAGRGISCHYPQRSRAAAPNARPPSAAFQLMAAAPAPPPSPPRQSALHRGFDFSIDAMMDEFCAVDPLPVPGQSFSFASSSPSLLSPATTAEMSGGSGIGRSAGSSDDLGPPIDVNDMMCSEVGKQLMPLNTSTAGDNFCNTSLPKLLAGRLKYIFEYIPTTPGILVKTLGTPWCHPMVFSENTPQTYQDLLSCSALYCSMNHINKPIVMTIIVSRMRDLAAAPAPSNPYEALARTLALAMYHVMALLDGDIESRAAGQATLPSLTAAAASLLPHISPDAESSYPADLPLYPLDETTGFWRNWVLAESLRRTMLFTHQFAACYTLVSDPSELHDCRDVATYQSWTLSAHLWGADNAVDFAVAWGSKNRWLVSVARTSAVFEAAEAEDVCDFGRMLMASFMGHQQARGWFAMRGGKF